jgi:hypothetical protein
VDALQVIRAAPPQNKAAVKSKTGDKEELALPLANRGLDQFAGQLSDLMRPVLNDEMLLRAKVERQIAQAIRLDLGENELKAAVEAARVSRRNGEPATQQYDKCLDAYRKAFDIGKIHIAEAWLTRARGVVDESPDAIPQDKKVGMIAHVEKVEEADLIAAMVPTL